MVELSGYPIYGYHARIDGKEITGDQLDKMAEAGTIVIGIASSLSFTLPDGLTKNEVASGTVFRYENAVASRNPENLEDVSTHWYEFHAQINGVDYGIRYDSSGEWKGYAISSVLTFMLTEADGQPKLSWNGQIMPNWAVIELLNMASYSNRPVFCFQKNMRFFKPDGSVFIPAMYTPFSLMLSGAGEHIFFCEQDGYKYTVRVEQDNARSVGAAPTAEKTVAYKTAESKADDLEVDGGELFLLSGTERISGGVKLPTNSGGNGVTFTPSVDAAGNLSWTNDGDLPNPETVNIRGSNGEAATIEKVTAETDGSYLAQPTVTVTPGGTANKRTFHFSFKGLRGLAGSGTGGGVPGDWAENDPNSASYIYNRTHWKEVYNGPEGEVIAETEVSFTSNIKTVTGAMSDAIHAGGLYIVTWNGTEYQCVGKSGSDGNYIGNGSFMNAGNMTFEDTGEPFCVLLFGGTYYQLWKADTTAETITVRVVGKKETVWHKLDKGYLDEALQFGSETAEILPETTAAVDPEAGAALLSDIVDVKAGNTYIVNWNGTEYTCKAQAFTADGVTMPVLGNVDMMNGVGDSGEPFAIVCVIAELVEAIGGGCVIYPLDGSDPITLSITYNGIKKIDGKYLPDGVPYVETVATDILPEAVYEINPDSGSAEFMADLSLVDGQTYTVKYNGVEYSCVCSYVVMNIAAYVLGNLGALMGEEGTGEPFVFIYIPDAGFAGGFPLDGSASFTLSISGESKVVNKLSAELLPDGVPGIEPFDDVIMASFPTAVVEEVFFSDPVGTVIAGAVYRVNWGGTVYECVARHDSEQDLYLLGNGLLPNGDDLGTEHPFLIFIYGPASLGLSFGATCSVRTRDDITDDIKNNFSVVGAYKVQRINEYCMPRNYAPVVVHFDRNNNPDVPWDAAYQAIVEGRNVTAHSVNQRSVLYQVCGSMPSEIVFNAIHFIRNTLYLEQISWNAPDISGAAVKTSQTKLATT